MRQGLLGLVGAVAALVLIGCSGSVTPPDNDPFPNPPARSVSELTPEELSALQAFSEFGWNLFKAVYAQSSVDENIFISPLSVSYALGMALNGARGETYDSMLAALQFHDLDLEMVNAAYRELYRILAAADPSVKFTLANSFWYDRGVRIVPSYLDRCGQYFSATSEEIEFSDPATPPYINDWVSNKTAGKITDIVPDPIPHDWVAMILNAIYFKGDWTYPFEVDETKPRRFRLASGSTKNVDMMARTAEYDWTNYKERLTERPIGTFEGPKGRGFNLPYGDEGFVMTVVLPLENEDLARLVSATEAEDITIWGRITSSYYHAILLPKFRYRWKDSLIDVLTRIGFGIAFDPGRADFRNMFADLDPWIGEVIHSSFVQVDEKGTEAAAATLIGFPTSMPPIYHCDQPFLFFIQERTSGAVLFIGKVGDPVWEN